MTPTQGQPNSGPDSPGSLPRDYFEELYGRSADGDPWRFTQSHYEAAKYSATLARLPRSRYDFALEVGCSIGVFTRMLADRVDRLLAIDVANAALVQARLRCRDRPNVRFESTNPLVSIPSGPFDLIVLAEVGYYWTPGDFHRGLSGLARELAEGGQIILVHWRSPVPDYPQTGDEVHTQAKILAEELGLAHLGEWVEEKYRTDLWERPLGKLRSARPS